MAVTIAGDLIRVCLEIGAEGDHAVAAFEGFLGNGEEVEATLGELKPVIVVEPAAEEEESEGGADTHFGIIVRGGHPGHGNDRRGDVAIKAPDQGIAHFLQTCSSPAGCGTIVTGEIIVGRDSFEDFEAGVGGAGITDLAESNECVDANGLVFVFGDQLA